MAYNTFEGSLKADGLSFGIVLSRFNNFITDKLLEGALDCLKRHGAVEDKISVAYVPGGMEIPMTAARMARSEKFDAVLCLGAVIRGETPHFDYVAAESSKGVARIGVETGLPVIYGIITADTIEQAVERAGSKAGNKGWDAAMAAIEMVNLFREMN